MIGWSDAIRCNDWGGKGSVAVEFPHQRRHAVRLPHPLGHLIHRGGGEHRADAGFDAVDEFRGLALLLLLLDKAVRHFGADLADLLLTLLEGTGAPDDRADEREADQREPAPRNRVPALGFGAPRVFQRFLVRFGAGEDMLDVRLVGADLHAVLVRDRQPVAGLRGLAFRRPVDGQHRRHRFVAMVEPDHGFLVRRFVVIDRS